MGYDICGEQPQKKKRKTIKTSVKNNVLTNQQFKCKRCRELLDLSHTHFDHIIPHSEGGSDEANNIVALCMNCHGDKTAEDRLRTQHKAKDGLKKDIFGLPKFEDLGFGV